MSKVFHGWYPSKNLPEVLNEYTSQAFVVVGLLHNPVGLSQCVAEFELISQLQVSITFCLLSLYTTQLATFAGRST